MGLTSVETETGGRKVFWERASQPENYDYGVPDLHESLQRLWLAFAPFSEPPNSTIFTIVSWARNIFRANYGRLPWEDNLLTSLSTAAEVIPSNSSATPTMSDQQREGTYHALQFIRESASVFIKDPVANSEQEPQTVTHTTTSPLQVALANYDRYMDRYKPVPTKNQPPVVRYW